MSTLRTIWTALAAGALGLAYWDFTLGLWPVALGFLLVVAFSAYSVWRKTP